MATQGVRPREPRPPVALHGALERKKRRRVLVIPEEGLAVLEGPVLPHRETVGVALAEVLGLPAHGLAAQDGRPVPPVPAQARPPDRGPAPAVPLATPDVTLRPTRPEGPARRRLARPRPVQGPMPDAETQAAAGPEVGPGLDTFYGRPHGGSNVTAVDDVVGHAVLPIPALRPQRPTRDGLVLRVPVVGGGRLPRPGRLATRTRVGHDVAFGARPSPRHTRPDHVAAQTTSPRGRPAPLGRPTGRPVVGQGRLPSRRPRLRPAPIAVTETAVVGRRVRPRPRRPPVASLTGV